MGISISQSPGSLKRLRKGAWKFQQTFQTPAMDLARFSQAIVGALSPVQSANVIIDQVIFDPRCLWKLLPGDSTSMRFEHEATLTATGLEEVTDLLAAALGDGIDFAFVPSPRPFVIYADHHDSTTFFAQTKSNLNRVVRPLSEAQFNSVEYQRPF